MDDFLSLSDFLKDKFQGKVAKISLNGGFSCPNRTNGRKGCLFCTDSGSGEFSGDPEKSISEQIHAGRAIMDRKWNNIGYIAYFQNFTNTYADVSILKELYDQALNEEGVLGLAIATRPDCLGEDVLELLDSYNKKTFLWVELGLQTSNEETAELIDRGYANDIFVTSADKLHKLDIRTVVHLIAGLPGEIKDDFLASVCLLNNLRPWGVKFHNLYIQSNSPIYSYSRETGFEPLEMYEYIDWVTDALILIDKDIVIHRLTGDPDKNLLVSPMWVKDKLRVLSEIRRVYKEKSEANPRF